MISPWKTAWLSQSTICGAGLHSCMENMFRWKEKAMGDFKHWVKGNSTFSDNWPCCRKLELDFFARGRTKALPSNVEIKLVKETWALREDDHAQIDF